MLSSKASDCWLPPQRIWSHQSGVGPEHWHLMKYQVVLTLLASGLCEWYCTGCSFLLHQEYSKRWDTHQCVVGFLHISSTRANMKNQLLCRIFAASPSQLIFLKLPWNKWMPPNILQHCWKPFLVTESYLSLHAHSAWQENLEFLNPWVGKVLSHLETKLNEVLRVISEKVQTPCNNFGVF